MRGPRIIGVGCVAVSLGVIASIVYSAMEMGLAAGLMDIVSTRWGVTTMVDLYVGLGFVGAWIACVERSAARTIPWVVALACTGNLATVVYVAVRAFRAESVREIFIPTAPRPA